MKRLIASCFIFAVVLSGVFFTTPQLTKADCEHYFVVEEKDNIRYLVEYDCEGSVVNVTVLED